MDDDDWGFDEGSFEYNDYEHVGNDLSDEVNNGQRVRDLRMLIEMTPDALAARTGLSANDLLAIEAGMLHLEHDTALEIAAVLGVNLSDIWIES